MKYGDGERVDKIYISIRTRTSKGFAMRKAIFLRDDKVAELMKEKGSLGDFLRDLMEKELQR